MQLKSNAFENNGTIPTKYTCDGRDVSPQLSWSEVPEGTKSFALTVIDPDAPRGDFIHWLVCDIPADTREISEGGPLPKGARQVQNDFRKEPYGGPCPPSGTHRYYFTLYALDAERLEARKEDFVAQCKKHSIAQAQLMGKYSRG